MNGLPYYKAYPRDFIEGTVGMPFELKAAYRLVIDAIYMQGGNLPDDPRYIAGLLGCSVKKWNSLRAGLIAAGKITVRGTFLANDRADKELEILGRFQDKQRENRSRPNKNNELQSPRCDHTEPEPDVEEEEKKERTPLPPKGGDEGEFSKFWDTYPHRGGTKRNRKGALAKWAAAVKRGVKPEAILAGVERMKGDPAVVRGYPRDPATWLNQEGWADEITPSNVVPLPARPGLSPGEIELGGGWTWVPGDPVEYNRTTKEVRDAKHIRDRRMAEAEIAMRGCL